MKTLTLTPIKTQINELDQNYTEMIGDELDDYIVNIPIIDGVVSEKKLVDTLVEYESVNDIEVIIVDIKEDGVIQANEEFIKADYMIRENDLSSLYSDIMEFLTDNLII